MKNHLRKLIVTTLTLMFAFVAASAQTYFLHTVEKGQGLYSISRMYGVTEQEIIKLNPGSERVIKVGESLKIPQKQENASDEHYHTIKAGETLYSLSVQNRVSIKELCDANPGLGPDNFRIGEVIKIPSTSFSDPFTDIVPVEHTERAAAIEERLGSFKTTHQVKRRETVYRICRDYGITQEEFYEANPEFRNTKLKNGAVVQIPYSAGERELMLREQENVQESLIQIPDLKLFQMSSSENRHPDKISAALILPFELEDSSSLNQKKMVEFYQGVLLALKKLKAENVSVDLKVYDSKSEERSISHIFEEPGFSGVNIIFGPRYNKHIAEASRYSKENRIPLVLPINSHVEEVFDNPYIFQLNTSIEYYQQVVYDQFVRFFKNPRVVILKDPEYSDSKFLTGLRQYMAQHNIPNITLQTDTVAELITNSLSADHHNIFVMNSAESSSLTRMLPILQMVERSKPDHVSTSLFGYPEYQIYATDHLDKFFEINTVFYSWFYTNNSMKESLAFHNEFSRAFSRQMMVSYPSYASYGYDMTYYFIKLISLYGTEFYSHTNTLHTNPVQMGFKFDRIDNWGGFINRKVFFVNYRRDYTVQKIDFDR